MKRTNKKEFFRRLGGREKLPRKLKKQQKKSGAIGWYIHEVVGVGIANVRGIAGIQTSSYAVVGERVILPVDEKDK